MKKTFLCCLVILNFLRNLLYNFVILNVIFFIANIKFGIRSLNNFLNWVTCTFLILLFTVPFFYVTLWNWVTEHYFLKINFRQLSLSFEKFSIWLLVYKNGLCCKSSVLWLPKLTWKRKWISSGLWFTLGFAMFKKKKSSKSREPFSWPIYLHRNVV